MDANTLLAVVVVLSFVVIVLLISLATSPRRAATRAKLQFEEWRAKELAAAKLLFEESKAKEVAVAKQEFIRTLTAEFELKMLQWRGAHEANIRADAITRSAAVIRGKVSEHLAPFINFPYNPRDARFLGNPIDIIVFDGADEGNVREIVFLEVKTGLSPRLTPREKQVQQIVLEKKVVWQELFIGQT